MGNINKKCRELVDKAILKSLDQQFSDQGLGGGKKSVIDYIKNTTGFLLTETQVRKYISLINEDYNDKVGCQGRVLDGKGGDYIYKYLDPFYRYNVDFKKDELKILNFLFKSFELVDNL